MRPETVQQDTVQHDTVRLDTVLWRAVSLFRVAALLYAFASAYAYLGTYRRPGLALAVLAAMTLWTGLSIALYARGRGWSLLTLDLSLTVAALLSSVLVFEPERILAGDPTLTVSWAAAPVLAWALFSGPVAGTGAGAVVGLAAVLVRGGASQATVNSLVLLLLVGAVVGYVVQVARRAETAYARVVSQQAATAERERLARSVHDGVLQCLALVTRHAPPELAAAAHEQEVSLRRLIGSPPLAVPAGTCDLLALLPSGPDVETVGPGAAVLLPAATARELAAATAAAVDNARRHGGGYAWLLVEDETVTVTVTVRDGGPGIPDSRLAQAEREGRLGVSQSIRGRVRDLGGTVTVLSPPGQGTEVELRVPRR